MRPRGGDTSMGGQPAGFQQTRWTVIHSAKAEDTLQRQAALGQLFDIYWKPVYCYLRRKGYDNEEAKDLTQGFFQEIALGKGLVEQADRSKGRFRSFLLTALDHYVASIRRGAATQKRSPATAILRLDGIDPSDVPDPASGSTPEDAFNYMWASALLDQVLIEVEQECLRSGKALHWEIFSARVVEPILNNVPAPLLEDICAQRGIEVQKASNMIVTVKRRFQAILKSHVQPLVSEDAEVDAEIGDLFVILSKHSARPAE